MNVDKMETEKWNMAPNYLKILLKKKNAMIIQKLNILSVIFLTNTFSLWNSPLKANTN